MFKRNIKLKPYRGMSAWRKVALATWRTSGESSVYGWTDFDAKGIRRVLEKFKAEGKRMSPTTIAAKAVAVAIASYPKVNGLIRFGKIYEREDVDIFLQVAVDDAGDMLSGIVIRQCDKKSLEEISEEIRHKAEGIKSGKKDEFAKITKMLAASPTWVIGLTLRFMGFLNYTLNLWSPLMGAPRDAFGSAMVTSVGMLGIQRGLAPLLPFTPCPMIIAVGKIEEKPIVKDGEIVIGEIIPICVTFDHRLVDGVGASHMFKALTEYMENPQ